MLLRDNKSTSNSQTTTETINEIKLLKNISKTIDTLLINKIQDGSNAEIPKNFSARSKNSPHHDKLISSRSGKYGRLFDDLTEITVTDAITDQSESSRLNCIKEIIPFHFLTPKTRYINNLDTSKRILVVPDSSYKNAVKFNEERSRMNQSNFNARSVFRKPSQDDFRLPLLCIETPVNTDNADNMFVSSSKRFVADILITNDQLTDQNCDFIVSPDVLLDRLSNEHFQNKKLKSNDIVICDNNKMARDRKFILQNLLQVNLSKLCNKSYNEHPSPYVSFSTKSSSHLTMDDKNQMSCSLNKNDDLSFHKENGTIVETNSDDDEIMSDTVMYHGYMITPDFISKMHPRDSSKLPLKEMRDINVEVIHEMDTSPSANDFNHLKKYPVPLIIEKVPILPPDLLGNIKITNDNSVKRFLSVKSVTDPSWNDFKNIVLEDDFNQLNQQKNVKPEITSFRQIKISEEKEKLNDELTEKILESDPDIPTKTRYLKNNLVRSLKEMDKKICEMEIISSVMENNFINSKKLLISTKEKDLKSKGIKANISINNKRHRPLILVDTISTYDNNPCPSEEDITNIISNEIIGEKNGASQLTENQSSKQANLRSLSKLNLNLIENDPNEDTILTHHEKTMNSETSSYVSEYYKIRRDLSNIRNMNRMKRDRIMCLQRKKEAQKLAIDTLNEIGLPTQVSAEIPLNIIHNPTPNEMMLNQLLKCENSTNTTIYQVMYNESPFLTYKPIRHVSFTNKVRLQRPEITRRRNTRNPITYSDQLLKLQPQHVKRQILTKPDTVRNIPRNGLDLTPRSVISEDTDINSVLTDWSVPDDVKRILNENSFRDGLIYTEDLSQIQSINSNSVIDWDQISEILQQHDK